MISAIFLIIITIFLPPVGVALVAGCGADLCINILLTLLGYFPGHIHAFYVEYIYYRRRDQARMGIYEPPAPGVYSSQVQNVAQGGSYAHGQGTIPPHQHQQQPGYAAAPPPQANYGTVQQPPQYGKIN